LYRVPYSSSTAKLFMIVCGLLYIRFCQGSTLGAQIIQGGPEQPVKFSRVPRNCFQNYSPSSFHSHRVILTVISRIHCKSPETTLIILPGTPELQGPSSLQISGVPGPALGCSSGAAQNFVINSGSRTGCTSLGSGQP